MYAYVGESYPHQTHFSIPFTMIVVWIYLCVCVCVPFWNATLNLFGQSETVWERILFWLTDHPTIHFPVSLFCPLVTTHPFASGDPYHYLKLFNRDTFFFWISLSTVLCLTLPQPDHLNHCSGFICKRPGSQIAFFSCLLVCTSIVKMGGKWLIQSSVSS